jgi:hypothetical protein
MLGFTDSIGFFALFFAFFMELLKTNNTKEKIQYDHALKITDKEKETRLFLFMVFVLAVSY